MSSWLQNICKVSISAQFLPDRRETETNLKTILVTMRKGDQKSGKKVLVYKAILFLVPILQKIKKIMLSLAEAFIPIQINSVRPKCCTNTVSYIIGFLPAI